MRLLSRRNLLIGGGAAVAAAGLARAAVAQRPGNLRGSTPIQVVAKPIDHLSVADPDRNRFGSLLFRSGLELKSSNSAFGGFSALLRSDEGRQLIALSDKAQWLKARVETSDGRLSGLSDAVMMPLFVNEDGTRRRSRYNDTESIAIAGRTAYVGVESRDAVLRFDIAPDGAFLRGVPLPVPQEVRELPSSTGLEAVGVAPPGSPLAGAVVAVAERSRSGASAPTQGFIITGPQRGLFEVVRSDDYDVTDLAFLPGGDALLLERRFSVFGGFACRLRRLSAAAIRPGGRADGPVLYESDASQQIDNMEGLSIHHEGGETVLTLISDDNFNFFQRTLLLEFTLAG